MRASNPQRSTAAAIVSFPNSGRPDESAFTSVLRRWLNAARTTANSSFSSVTATGGAVRTRSRTTLDVTFGAGRKQPGATSNKISGSACHWVNTVNAPYSAEPVRHLALHHDGDFLEAPGLQKRRQQRRCDVVRQVRAHDGAQPGQPLAHECGQVELQHVAEHQLDVCAAGERLREDRAQALVQLHGHDLPRAPGQLCRQAADAGAGLQHAGAIVGHGLLGDALRHPCGGEEVLPHRLGEPEPVPVQ